MRIVVAMSGGVDSSVAAYQLKKMGHEVIGVTMKTWPKEECGGEGEKLCCSLEAVQSARSVAEDFGFPHYVVDYSKGFDQYIKKYFEEEYKKGRTPNPCVLCNSKLKFGLLIDKAKELGAERIATGHFARIQKNGEIFFLKEALDEYHDQTYFLYAIPKEKLEFIEFPLGDYTKEDVRIIAHQNALMPADRKSSQDICFATAGGDYRQYLKDRGVKAFSPGNIVDQKGNVLGEHKGIASYTVGQRKGIGVARPEPLYVLKIDPANNTVTVGGKDEAMKKRIIVKGLNWFIDESQRKERKCLVRIRYNGEKIPAKFIPKKVDEVIVEFDEPQFAPTPGQAAVFYDDKIVLCGGWIEEVLE